MASLGDCGNNGGVAQEMSFAERGGWWVAAQIPLLLVALFLAPWTSHAGGAFGQVAQYVGALVVFTGVATIAASIVVLGASLTPYPRPRDASTLITRGIYRYLRHPIYSGLIAATLGWALIWLSPAGVGCAVVAAVFFDRKATHEETWLTERYPGYAAYARRVRRFLPYIY
jgi:protein-S-isoprenylcysteine O-methyltransferase Ste14